MKIRPLHNRIVIKRLETPDTSEGGIVIPEGAKITQVEGEVIAMGKGKTVDGFIRPMTVKKGDRVVFSVHSGTEVTVDGEDLVIILDDDVFAIVGNSIMGSC